MPILSTASVPVPAADVAPASEDLGPLAWVLAEIQKSLDGAGKLLRRFAHDSGNTPEIDGGTLRAARAQLHQAVGALQMVGYAAPARVLGAMEFAVQSFVLEPMRCTDVAVHKIERAGFAVADFLQAQLGGKQVSPIALFAQYRDVLELVGNERVHPADLWPHPWRWAHIPRPVVSKTLVYDPAVRSKLDRDLLKVVRSGDDEAARRLHELCLGLARGASAPHVTDFWTLAGGFFEALALGLVPADVYAKRAASRVMLQYATLARGDNTVSERLAQDLLFFCAQAVPDAHDEASTLRAVRTAWGVTDQSPVDYTTEQFGRFDPVVLGQARKRIETAKELWSSLSGGDMSRLRQAIDTFEQLAESLQKLHPASLPMAQALNNAVDASLRSGRPPGTDLAMEVATSVLYLEAAFEDLDPHDRQLTARTVQLAGRIERARESGRSEPLEPWMEELYRRVSDKQSMGTVVDELRVHLSELEKSLDQFFRRPTEKGLLRAVPGQLLQMRGVFSVLGLDQAAQTVQSMRESVERLLTDDGAVRTVSDFDSLGNNLGALGFLNDMLGYQPALAKRLFVFDAEAGELKPLMGRQADPGEASRSKAAEAAVASASATAGSTGAQPSSEEVDAQIAARLAELASDSSKPASPIEEFVAAADSWTAKITGPAPLEPTSETDVAELEEDDLQNIFLDEAREVLHNGLAAVSVLDARPGENAELTVLRRAFHTLKGSARMVGLVDFGEAAWSFEQVLNTWLADQRTATPQLVAGTGTALREFSAWVEAIASGTAHAWKSEPFIQAAQGLQTGDQVATLALPRVDSEALAVVARHIAAEPSGLAVPEDEVEAMPPVDATPEIAGAESRDVDLPALELEHEPVADVDEEAARVDFDDFPSTDFLGLDGAPSSPAHEEATLADAGEFDFLATQHAPFDPAFAPTALAGPGELGPAPTPSPASVPEVVAEHVPLPDIEPLQAHELETDGSFPAPLQPVALDAGLAPEPLVAEESKSAEEPAVEAPAEPVAEPVHAEPELAEEDEHATLAATADAEALADVDGDDAVKAIGPLRIGVALYNVYLNEADEWSRQLVNDVGEWALEPHRRIADSTVSLAHSLAGSSATVGFQGMSNMARLFESALQHLHLQGHGTPEQGATLTAAAEELRRLLHQFAAGFLKEPAAETLQALREVAFTDVPGPVQMVSPARLRELHGADVALEDSDDAIDLQDALDPDLFPVFEEEAAELLPQLANALRQWAQEPEDGAPRASVLRTLHTLKGSARLAGALRVGERAHRIESEVELLGRGQVEVRDIEQLLHRFDAMQAAFDGLRPSVEEALQAAVQSAEREAALAHGAANAESVPSGAGHALPSQAFEDADASEPRSTVPLPTPTSLTPLRQAGSQVVRIHTHLLDRLVAQSGEVIITRARLEGGLGQLRNSLQELTGNLDRLRNQLRDIEVQAEGQMQSRLAQAKDSLQAFDPLEFDRFTRVQELTRMMAETVNDVASVQRTLRKTVQTTEDDLSAQARQTRELQRGLLRTRMVEFEGISERLYRVVRQASKDAGKQVKLDITGGTIEMDRGVLDRMTPAFEHLLRNSVAHGIEELAVREGAGKPVAGQISIDLTHEGNDVSVTFRDDGGGLDAHRITERALALGMIEPGRMLAGDELIDMIFRPGFSTASRVSELAGRGIGMDVVRSDIAALGGRIEIDSTPGQGSSFKLVLPLTTAITHVVMLRAGEVSIGVPSTLVERVQRASAADLENAYQLQSYEYNGQRIPFFWAGALLNSSAGSARPPGKTNMIVIARSAAQHVALHVDEVPGNNEVVVKNLGPQLSRLPGMTGISVLASGAVTLIYNPVALAAVHGQAARALQASVSAPAGGSVQGTGGTVAPTRPVATVAQAPLVLVVDDSITVRRVTQRLLQREGYRVALASDGLQALSRLQEERPAVVLSDIEMPRMDGFDLARNIRADETLAGLPIIMITSRIAEKHREHAKTLGVDHYLGKPYSEEQLLGLLRDYTKMTAAPRIT